MNRIGMLVILLPVVVALTPGGVLGQRALAQEHGQSDRVTSTSEGEHSERGNAWLKLSAHPATLLPSTVISLGELTREPDVTSVTPQVRDRAGVPYMIAGGILFIAGVLVDGDAGTILLIGGAGIGAYGAFVYFGG